MPSAEGNLTWLPLADRADLVAPPVAAAAHLVPGARVAEIDPHLADTATFCETYDVAPDASANCVVVAGRRGDEVTYAAVMILATDRADINKVVRKELGVRKVSFADQEDAETRTGMIQGGITPIGLPDGWPILVDRAVVEPEWVVVGSGIRGSKIILPGGMLIRLPYAEVLELAQPG